MTASDSSNGKEESSRFTGASQTTSFSAKWQKAMTAIGVTLLGALLGAPIYLTAIPYLKVMTHMVKSQPGESSLQWWTKYAIAIFFYSGTLLVAAVVVLLPVFGPRVTGYHALALYIPMVIIASHDRRYPYGAFATPILENFFDFPLVVAGYICREFFGLRMLAPFCNIIDDTIVQGSMPFPSDIETLASEPYNVGLIVNMCREYQGATMEMKKKGVVQCHLPNQDTTAPSYESLVKGCAHIRQFKRHNPKKRVYVHCKGGIARASTMSLAHYVVNEGLDPEVAIKTMKAKRHVVLVAVKDYPAIQKLNSERLSKQKQEETKPKKN